MNDIPATRARLMTWNIWWRFGPCWQDRQDGVLETLRGVDADVVALQEVWGTAETTQAHEFADRLGLHAGFAAPSYPPAPDPPETPDHEGVALGLGLLSRWPIASLRQVELPARHRTLAPVTMVASLEHPAGLLHVVVACLEYEPAYNDDRIAQAHALVDLATDPDLDGPLPVIVAGDLNAAPDSPVLRPLHDAPCRRVDRGRRRPGRRDPPLHPSLGPRRGRRADRPADRPHLPAAGATQAAARRRVGHGRRGTGERPLPLRSSCRRLRPELDLSERKGMVDAALARPGG
ncbi:MAG TPA: endonuclease/exonuclease/phosphatase family protein, partial [Propionibacteriaceae bacterium]|nr:endonuclease/exonuclease/phosphatase family protein [Propionibacteriaceae bacterium]